jgi:hypothetical protein
MSEGTESMTAWMYVPLTDHGCVPLTSSRTRYRQFAQLRKSATIIEKPKFPSVLNRLLPIAGSSREHRRALRTFSRLIPAGAKNFLAQAVSVK